MTPNYFYTPPRGWLIIGYRKLETRSRATNPCFQDYGEQPIHYYTHLREAGKGYTALVKKRYSRNTVIEWLLFSPAENSDDGDQPFSEVFSVVL